MLALAHSAFSECIATLWLPSHIPWLASHMLFSTLLCTLGSRKQSKLNSRPTVHVQRMEQLLLLLLLLALVHWKQQQPDTVAGIDRR